MVLFADGSQSDRAGAMGYDGSSWSFLGGDDSGFVPTETGAIDYPALAREPDSSSPHFFAVYTDAGNSTSDSVEVSAGIGAAFLTEVDTSSAEAQYASVAAKSDGDAFVAYLADPFGTPALTVANYDYSASNLSTLSHGTGFSSGSGGDYVDVAVDSTDVPYVAFSDIDDGGKPYVKRYSAGTGFVDLATGSNPVSSNRAYDLQLAFDSNDNAYLAYRDAGNGDALTVQKWDGSSWTVVGSVGVSAGSISSPSMAIDSQDVPHVAYNDDANSDAITVVRYNGSSWETVGSAGFSPGQGFEPSLAIGSNDVPYVVFKDNANGGKLTAMTYR